jgi:hypothetical protein
MPIDPWRRTGMDWPAAGIRSASDSGKVLMTDLIIHSNRSSTNDCCALCGGETVAGDGPQLLQARSLDAVCRKCGKEHAPELVALLDLACTADRIGRLAKHTLVPPLTALLDLARAAEDYTFTPRQRLDHSRPKTRDHLCRNRLGHRLCAAAQ